jgi:hypothetical protein
LEEKVQYARDCRAQDAIETPLLVDDLNGAVHRAYGEMPNMVYIVDKQGKIVYKALWTDPAEIESVLDNLVMPKRWPLGVSGSGLRTPRSSAMSLGTGRRCVRRC